MLNSPGLSQNGCQNNLHVFVKLHFDTVKSLYTSQHSASEFTIVTEN